MSRPNPATGCSREARERLPSLAAGESLTIDLHDDPYWRRECYRAVNAAAHKTFGAGWYRLDGRIEPGKVIVTRLRVPIIGRTIDWKRQMQVRNQKAAPVAQGGGIDGRKAPRSGQSIA